MSRRAYFFGVVTESVESVEALHADVLESNHALWIVRLKRERSFIELARERLARLGAGWLGIFQHNCAIDAHGDFVVSDGDVLRPPGVIPGRCVPEVHDVVEAAGFLPVAVAHVDLTFETDGWPAAFLIRRVKVDAAVRIGLGHHIDFELEVFEWLFVADVEQVTAITARHQSAVLDFPGVRVFDRHFPASEAFPVKNAHKAIFTLRERGRGKRKENCRHQRESRFHGRTLAIASESCKER